MIFSGEEYVLYWLKNACKKLSFQLSAKQHKNEAIALKCVNCFVLFVKK